MGIMDLFMQVTQSDIKWFVTHCLERIFISLCLEDISSPKLRDCLFF